MSTEFEPAGPNCARSVQGFTVRWVPASKVEYEDEEGKVKVYAELLQGPHTILLYTERSPELTMIAKDRAEDIIARITKALEYIKHQVAREEPRDTSW